MPLQRTRLINTKALFQDWKSGGMKLSRKTKHIRIPARPFLGPPIKNLPVQKEMLRKIQMGLFPALSKGLGRVS